MPDIIERWTEDGPEFNIQELINSGMAWSLEGSVGRACMAAIEAGYAVLGTGPIRDYYGNLVPSRHMVQPGSVGSVLFHHRVMHTTSYKNCSPCRRLRKEGRS